MNGKQTSPDPRVTVVVTAYNQADLVERCLDSVAAQKTSFGVRIVVADDASTDGTADVVRAWAAKRPEAYKSTGIQCSSNFLSANSLSLCGSIYLKKYQEEPALPGIVDVSLLPLTPFISTFTQS